MTFKSGLLAAAAALALGMAPALAQDDAQTSPYVWDLTDLYESDAAWEAERERLAGEIATLAELEGTLGRSGRSMADGLEQISNLYKDVGRLFVYASLKNDEDQRIAESQTRIQQARQLFSEFGQATAWLSPEILTVGERQVARFLSREDRLDKFEFQLSDTLRQAPHTLDDKGEQLMAQAGLVLSAPNQIYSLLANADIDWPTAELSSGEEARLSQAGYSRYRSSPVRADRKLVFDTFWGKWKDYEDSMGAILNTEVQSNVFSARARNYESVLAANLSSDDLPPEIYTTLVERVNEALPTFHRYLELRGRLLGVDDLRYYDIYPPLVELETGGYDIERSTEITFEALQPFGEKYLGHLEYGLSQQWMHAYPQEGKETGAYMSGFAYDVHPYVLLNHNDDYNSLSTFAHEWGHAVHTMLANEVQPWENASYATFLAEMASTINEILLEEHMIANAQTKEEKLFFLGQALESIRGTVFRQTMFAEFELRIHQAVESGEPLTGARMTEIYLDLLKNYHGHDQGVLTVDDLYGIEWAYIPHFYYDFYVFQYATSMSGAAWFAEQFLSGDDGVREAFIRVLEAGGSAHPHDILKNEAGLDMTQAGAYDAVFRRMDDLMDRIETLLEE